MQARFDGQGASLPNASPSTPASASTSTSALASQSSYFSRRAIQLQTPEDAFRSPPAYRTASIANDSDPIVEPAQSSRSNRGGRARAGTLPSSWGDAAPIIQQPSPIDRPPLLAHLSHGSGSNSKSDALLDLASRGALPQISAASDPAHFDPALTVSCSSQRLRSGSLTLPTANLANAFGPSFFSSNWQPTRSGLSTMTSAATEDDSNSPSQTNDTADPRFSFGNTDTLDYLGLSGADRREPNNHVAANANEALSHNSDTDRGFVDADAYLASVQLRNRSSTLGVHQLRPRLNNGDGRARSSSYLTSFAFSTAPTASESAPHSTSNSVGLHSGHVSGSQSPYAANAPQSSLLNTALQNRLHQYSAATSSPSSDFSNRASANASRPRATSMGVLDQPHSRAPALDHYLATPSAVQTGLESSLTPPAVLSHHRNRQVASAALTSGSRADLYSDLSALFAGGRNRAGTIAAFSGPGGRARAEQELLRMTQMQYDASLTRESKSRPSSSSANEALANIDMYSSARPQQQRAAAQRSGANSPFVQPTRTLWIGHLRPTVTSSDLVHIFSRYGSIETVRLVPEKSCAFINYADLADAVRAREDVFGRMNGRLGLGTIGPEGQVRVGFGKPESLPQAGFGLFATASDTTGAPLDAYTSEVVGTEGGNQEPSRALWIGSIPSSTSIETLISIFAPFGPIESVRVLASKSCAFINYERLDDAMVARQTLHGRDVLGAELGPMRIGFAKVPANASDSHYGSLDSGSAEFQAAIEALSALAGAAPGASLDSKMISGLEELRYASTFDASSRQHLAPNALGSHGLARDLSADSARLVSSGATGRATGFPTHSSSNSIVPSSDKGGVPLPAAMKPKPTINDLQSLMRELDELDPNVEADVAQIARPRPLGTYFTRIPSVPELPPSKRFDNNRLKEVRKRLETPSCLASDADAIARDYLPCVVDLSSDFIGNTLVQKFFERCSEPMKKTMLTLIAPHLAMIGVHKNGTWAAQKIIDCTHADDQRVMIVQHIRPYVPPLLLDQFGNYVVQRLIPFGSPHSDFIFEAMVDRCWEVAQGRFGSRSMRTCLESSAVHKFHIKQVALAIVLNSVPLTTSQNGTLLVTWLLDASSLPGRFRLLAPRLAPHLANLCTHKLASQTVLRIISQKEDPDASRQLLGVLFGGERLQLLEEILVDQVHGSQFVTKLFAEANALQGTERQRCGDEVKALLLKHGLVNMPPYRPLAIEMGLVASMTPNSGPGTPYSQTGLNSSVPSAYDTTGLERQMGMMNVGTLATEGSAMRSTRRQLETDLDAWSQPSTATAQDFTHDPYNAVHTHHYQTQQLAQAQHQQHSQRQQQAPRQHSQQPRSLHSFRAYF